MRKLVPSAVLASLAISCGCNFTGARALRSGRQDYNVAIQQTANEQLLLNLVRLRYRDNPLFLEVGSIASSFAFESGVGGDAKLPDHQQPMAAVFGVNARLGYAERPTIAYVPLQGEKFVKQLLAPLSLETLLLMYHSGWSIERIFRCCVQRMNGLRNAPGASGPTPELEPEYRSFRRVISLLRRLQVQDALTFGVEKSGDTANIVLGFAEHATDREEAKEIRTLLGVAPDANSFVLKPSVGTGQGKEIGVVTRSLMGVLFFLSQGVEIPAEDAASGRVTVTKSAAGAPFDWQEVVGGLFRVRDGGSLERGAAVAVDYRGHSFAIDDSDLDTKSTFTLLMQLFALQAGGSASGGGPVLTLSVGQ